MSFFADSAAAERPLTIYVDKRELITLRHALEDSRNVPTVRLMEQLTPAQVIDRQA